MEDIQIGDKFQYISEIPDYSFNFMVFGINKVNLDIIVNRATTPALYKLKLKEIDKCVRIEDENIQK